MSGKKEICIDKEITWAFFSYVLTQCLSYLQRYCLCCSVSDTFDNEITLKFRSMSGFFILLVLEMGDTHSVTIFQEFAKLIS